MKKMLILTVSVVFYTSSVFARGSSDYDTLLSNLCSVSLKSIQGFGNPDRLPSDRVFMRACKSDTKNVLSNYGYESMKSIAEADSSAPMFSRSCHTAFCILKEDGRLFGINNIK